MKYSAYLFASIAVLLFFTSSPAQSKVLKPGNVQSKIWIKVAGNDREYYSLDSEKENIISVRGPGKLKIITRPRFASDKQKNANYSIFYKVDGSVKKEAKYSKISRAGNAVFKNKSSGVPGNYNTMVLNLSEGEHTIQIWGGNRKLKVDSRYLFIPVKQKKLKWVSLTPLSPTEPVNLISGEEVVNYFRFSEIKPLRIKITGPTKIRILTRVENHYNMKGRIFYRLKVTEDGILKNSYQLNSIRSESSAYQSDRTKIPGRAKEISVDVPPGSHVYEIVPLDKDKVTLLGKILFPKKDVSLGE